MARRCQLTGKGVLTGNNVSHSNIKTRRRYMPNLQMASLISDTLGRTIRLRLSVQAIRSVDKRGGLDSYLLAAKNAELPPEMQRLKRQIEKVRAARADEAAAAG